MIQPAGGGSLGIEIDNDPFAHYRGVRISHITCGSAAENSGIRVNDVLIAINGALVLGRSFNEIIDALKRAGQVIVFSVAAGKDVDAPGSSFWDFFDVQ